MGDGDLVDPALQDLDDDVGAAPVDLGDTQDDAAVDEDEPERASEVDDITDSLPRPTDDGGNGAGVDDVDVEALLAEREQFRSLAQRVQADFDNYRKRAGTQARADAERASGRLAEALLPVLDAAEAAYVQHPDEIGPLLNTMLTELKRHGLETLDLDGQPFDPEVADAVVHDPSGGGEPVVAEVLRTGYRWKGRVLRPAMVKTTD